MTNREQTGNAFVLRIWWEERPRPVWRGWIQHTATGQERYVQHLADLLAFVENHTGSLAQSRCTSLRELDQSRFRVPEG